ncbi:MAG: HDOD domain-containing protein [Planctomycetota bacterium]|jgi:HD-like signal output (HDOD) protein
MTQYTINATNEEAVQSITSQVENIISIPEVTIRIIEVVDDPSSSAADLHDVIKTDPALTARILKVVNSAFYGLPGQVDNADRAILLLGLSAVKNIAIASSMNHIFVNSVGAKGVSGQDLWKHSVAMAVATRMLCAKHPKAVSEIGFLAGMVADLGLLVAKQVLPEKFAEATTSFDPHANDYCAVETRIMGVNHQELGAALARKWKFPEMLCHAISHHHECAGESEVEQTISALLGVADRLACREQLGFCTLDSECEIPGELLSNASLQAEVVEEISAQLKEQVAIAESVLS